MKSFVKQGRIAFLGGGWVQNDEACTSVRDVLNQLTEGHLWLQDTFQATPRTGWQIDPFGNVASTGILFALCGFNATVTDRVAIETTLERIERGEMEYVWTPPPPYFQDSTLKQQTSIFAHQLGLLLYEGLPFVFEASDAGNGVDPVTPENLEDKILEFDISMQLRHQWYQKGNPNFLLFPWGGDFLFYNASKEFSNLDKILPRVQNATYATVPQYFDALRTMRKSWPERHGADLPYDWPIGSYWSGYFSSRAALKGAIRRLSSLVEVADSFYALSGLKDNSLFSMVQSARRTVGILQHHDAVTGTAKSFVVQDYFDMISNATVNASAVFQAIGAKLSGVELSDKAPAQNTYLVLTFNSLSQSSHRFVRFKLGPNREVGVKDLPYQIEGDEMVFGPSAVPSLGFNTIQVTPSNTKPPKTETIPLGTPFFIENDLVKLDFSSSHMLVSWTNKTNGKTHRVQHEYKRYLSEFGSAYLMRIQTEREIPLQNVRSYVTNGPVAAIVTTVINDHLNHTWRLYQGCEYAEITYFINSMAQPGYNLITRFSTDIQNGEDFYTDDSGWLLTKRKRAERIEAGYFPSVEFTFINDTNSQFAIISSQTHGVSSQKPGAIELNLFRRLSNEGFPPLGLSETLDDLTPSVDTQRVIFSETFSEFSFYRADLNNPLRPLFSTEWPTTTNFKGLRSPLPSQVSVFSLKSRDCCSDRRMVRLQNHGSNSPLVVRNVAQLFKFSSKQATQCSLNFIDMYHQVTDAVVEPHMIRAFLLE